MYKALLHFFKENKWLVNKYYILSSECTRLLSRLISLTDYTGMNVFNRR